MISKTAKRIGLTLCLSLLVAPSMANWGIGYSRENPQTGQSRQRTKGRTSSQTQTSGGSSERKALGADQRPDSAATPVDSFYSGIGNLIAGDGLVETAAGFTFTWKVGAGAGIAVAADTVSIADAGVTTAKIADNAVTTAKLADNSVTTPKIADNSVTSGKIQDGAVTSTKLASGAVTAQKISLPIGLTGETPPPRPLTPLNEYLLVVQNIGTTGGAGHFRVSNSANGDTALLVQTTGTGSAARFVGNVNVSGTLSKSAGSFKIDHPLDPENKYLYHSFVESPDMMNIYNGMVALDASGEAWVTLPAWFEALNQDFRYQLTAIAAPAPGLYVAQEVSGNRFKIAGGEPGGKISWQVTGIRNDPYAKAHRIPLEEDKSFAEQGFYLHPKLYGKSEEKSIEWSRDPEGMRQIKEQQEQSGDPRQ